MICKENFLTVAAYTRGPKTSTRRAIVDLAEETKTKDDYVDEEEKTFLGYIYTPTKVKRHLIYFLNIYF